MSDGEQISQPALQQQADPESSSGPILSQALRGLRPKGRNLLDGFVDIGHQVLIDTSETEFAQRSGAVHSDGGLARRRPFRHAT